MQSLDAPVSSGPWPAPMHQTEPGPASPIELDVSTNDRGVTVLGIRGAIDLAGSVALEQDLAELVYDGRTRLVLDLEHVDLIESSGLKVILDSRRLARSHRGDLVLAAPHETVVKALELSGLDRLVDCFEDVESAVMALDPRPLAIPAGSLA